MNDNDSNFPYPTIIQNKLNHPLLLPILPRIIIKNKEPVESEPNVNNVNYKNIYNNNIALNNKEYKDDFSYQLHNKNKNELIQIKNNKQVKNYNDNNDNNDNNFDDKKNIINNNNSNITKKIISKRISNNVLINNIFPDENNNDFKFINNNLKNNVFQNKKNQIKNFENNKIGNDSFLNNNIQQINKANLNNITNDNIVNLDINNPNKINFIDNSNISKIKVNINANLNQNNRNITPQKEMNLNNLNLGLNKTHLKNIQNNQKINDLGNNFSNIDFTNIKTIKNISNNETNITNIVIRSNNNMSKEQSNNTTNNIKKINNISNYHSNNTSHTIIKENNLSKEQSNNSAINIKKINNIPNNHININNNVIETNNQLKEQSNNTIINQKKINNIPNNQLKEQSNNNSIIINKINNNQNNPQKITNNLIEINNHSKEHLNNTTNTNKINNILNNQTNITNNINKINNIKNNQSNNKTTNIQRINNIPNNQQNNILNPITKINNNQNNPQTKTLNNIQENIINNQLDNTKTLKLNNIQNPINNPSNNNTINQINKNIQTQINNSSNNTTINKINNNKQNKITNPSNNTTINQTNKNTKNPINNIPQDQKNNLTNKNQTTFKYDTVTLTSEYNSGNMFNCKKISEDTYNVYISSDCQDRELDHQIAIYKVWFNFAVQSTITREMNINIVNLNNFLKVYRSGYQICIRELNVNEEPKDFENSYNLNEEIYWKRYGNFTASVDKENHLILKIKYKFESLKYVYFAFCFPFSYDKNNAFLNYLDNKINNNPLSKIYFHNEVLIQSKEKRNVNLITITSKDNIIKNQLEQNVIGLFPNKNRCNKTLHDKPIIFISARVHPGETPGSHMMNGILKLLTDEKDNKSILLRENFIFKIIPIINVDGVSIGNYRLDTNGYNLNRCYLNPDIKTDPEIFAIKKLFMLYNNIYKIRYYFDLHADMNVRGAYTYGNAIEKFENHVENVLYGFIFHLTSSHINWNHCIYSESSMKTKFKNDNNSKEATSRVHFYQKTGLIHTYTLESSYFKGDFDGINEKNDDQLYLINDFENTGRDCLISILHYEELTVNFNIANSIYNDIYGCREYIANSIQMSEERFNLNFGLKNIAKDINKRKNWKSIKELNDKYLLAKGNRNYSQKPNTTDLSLPKINKKLDSERLSQLPLINNNYNYDSNKINDKNNKQIYYSKKEKRNLTPIIQKINHNDNSDIVNYNEE